MGNKVRSILFKSGLALMCLVGAGLALAPAGAEAQQYISGFSGLTTVMNGGTNNVAATATNTYGNQFRIDVPKAEYVDLYLSMALSGAGTSGVRFSLAQGADESTFETNNTYQFILLGNGTTPVNLVTNINVGAIPYLKLMNVGNSNAVAVTNITVSYGFKR
jgi:hypothetical protein